MKRGKRKQYKRAHSQSWSPFHLCSTIPFSSLEIIWLSGFLQWLYLICVFCLLFVCLFRREGEEGNTHTNEYLFEHFKKDKEDTPRRGYSSVVEHLGCQKRCVCVCAAYIKLIMLASLMLPQRMFRETVLNTLLCCFPWYDRYILHLQFTKSIRLKRIKYKLEQGIHQHWHKYSKIQYNLRNISKLN